jgi:hypothetical protein
MSVEDYRRGGSIRFDQKWYQYVSAVSIPRQTIKNGEILPISKLLEMFSSKLVRLGRIGLRTKMNSVTDYLTKSSAGGAVGASSISRTPQTRPSLPALITGVAAEKIQTG